MITTAKKLPLVSIVVPNYNHGRFLTKRLQSIFYQTYQNFELIYLDDASTDNSNVVIQKFIADPRVTVSLNKKNCGSSFKQWNKGVKMAQGDYIWIAESDDYAEKTLLEKLVSLLDRNQSIGVVYCQSITIDENDQELSLWQPSGLDPSRWQNDFINSGIDECRHYLNAVNTIPNVSGVVFRKNIYQRAGMAPEDMKLAGDWLTWIKMLLVSDIGFIAEPLNYFRRSSQSISVHAFVSSIRVKERYMVSEYILNNLELAAETRKTIEQRLFDDWEIFASSERWWKLLWQNLQIYLVARKVDNNLPAKRLWKIFS